MAYEVGGRSDKYGNRFELNWVLSKLLDVIEEKIASVVVEALGDDEQGVDLWIEYKSAVREAQQCKGRNGSLEYWDYGTANSRAIWENWKHHLEQSKTDNVSLVSPISFTMLEDICNRARTNNCNAKDFYNNQILQSGRDTVALFKNICKAMDIDLSSDSGVEKARDYFARMYYRQVPDGELREDNLSKINRIYIGDSEIIYGILLDFITNKDIWGNKIDCSTINTLLDSKGVEYRNLAKDARIWPAIKRINDEYDSVFKTLSCGFITRKETQKCMEYINAGKSIIMHGSAGVGKSGCTENLINCLKKDNKTYVAIKLDRHIPKDNSEIWAETIGLPASVSHCLNAITDDKAVIILDQLDALRWTQAHSGNALVVCSQIIKEIQQINKERENPICLVFVCRTYDVNNDNGIASLFADDKEWEKVSIGPLDEAELQSVIGDKIHRLSPRTKNLLKIPSNLYIWEKLDDDKLYENIGAAYQLIKEWWRQISLEAAKCGLNSDILEGIKDGIVHFCYEHSMLNAPKAIVKIPAAYEEFLVSSGFIVSEKAVVSFVHQSIMDCFFAEEMLQKYYEGCNLVTIIGDKEHQTPGRRYQTQIFMQQLAEVSEKEFVCVGKELLYNNGFRYSFKYVFIEVLSQMDPSDVVAQCVKELVIDAEWKESVLASVVRGSSYYVHMLRDDGCLDLMMEDDASRNRVIDLMVSIKNELDNQDVLFIRKYIFDEEQIRNWSMCLWGDINNDSDAFFELRLDVYEKFPKLMDQYLDIKKMMQHCEMRTIRLLTLMLRANVHSKEESLYKCADEFACDDMDIFISEYRRVLECFVPLFPDGKTFDIRYSNWSARHTYKKGLERTCVLLTKLAAETFSKKEPEAFLDYFKFALGKENPLYNEVILDGMFYLPDSYADYVIDYLVSDSFKNALEDTSNNGNRLFYAKRLITRFSAVCSEQNLRRLEDAIIYYIPSDAKERLMRRIEFNRVEKEEKGIHVYWKYWGDLQQELLAAICSERISEKAGSLLEVLNHRYESFASEYNYADEFECCTVVSPVSGKALTVNNWLQIITSTNIKNRGKCTWKHKDGLCIENSLEDFADSFRQYVTEHPVELAEELSDAKEEKVNEAFIDAFFSGLASSKDVKSIDEEIFMRLIKRFGYNYESYRASYIAEIIEKIEIEKYKEYFLETIWDIIENHHNPNDEEQVVVSYDDKEGVTVDSIESNAINCVRGTAIHSFGSILWNDRDPFDRYKEKIENVAEDHNPIIRYASLYMLWPAYNYDRKWASAKIIKIFNSDCRLAGFRDSRRMLCYCYDDYADDVMGIVEKAFNSTDSRLKHIAGYTVVELYMLKGVFENIFELYLSVDSEQRKPMLEMAITYFGIPEYKQKAKALLEKIILVEDDVNNEFLWGKLFREKMVKLEEDLELIKSILKSKVKKNIISQFSEYVFSERKLKQFSDIVLELSLSIIENPDDIKYIWGIDAELLKLIFELYDETVNSAREEDKDIARKCLEVWDKMYEKNIGMARTLTEQMLCI